MEINKIICSDALLALKELPAVSIDCCITSPPYWGLRDYGVGGQLGLEKTPEEYVAKMIEVFREVKRVLKKEGTCWLNLGDSYSREGGDSSNKGRHWDGRRNNPITGSNRYAKDINLKPKDLVGIPWRVAFALQQDGWYLRQDLIWAKPNPMPESVTDRCTKSHEYIFLLAKSPNYYFDNEAIKEDATAKEARGGGNKAANVGHKNLHKSGDIAYQTRNRRSVWTITTKPFKDAHFATFPEDLIVPMVLAGCPKEVCNKCGKARERVFERESLNYKSREDRQIATGGALSGGVGKNFPDTKVKEVGLTDCGCRVGFQKGLVLDPFIGSGTTAVVAKKLGRNYLGIELNEKYVKMAEERIKGAPTPLF